MDSFSVAGRIALLSDIADVVLGHDEGIRWDKTIVQFIF